ncbi:glycine betaine ABC transporter substrate-binding protein OsmF [Salinispira pacifica]
MKRITLLVLAALLLGAGSLFASGSTEKAASAPEKGPIVVASKIDTEGALLGSMIVQLLQANGFKVQDRTQFGTTDVIRKAIINGEIDIYPEYTGNGGFFFPDSPRDVWKNAKAGYEEVKKLDMQKNNLVWLQPAPANNTWAIAARKDFADKNNIKTLEDLARYMSNGGTVKLAASEEFVSRPDALPAFEKAYGFHFTSDELVTLSGGNTATTEKAAAQGTNGVNLAMAYGTDGQLAALGLVVLTDTKGVQPVYNPAPLVRNAIITKYPEIRTILDPVFKSLTLETLQKLNSAIAVDGKNPKDVAKKYLTDNGFLK